MSGVVEVRGVRALKVNWTVCVSRAGNPFDQIWTRRVVSDYDNVRIENLSTSFRDGLAFCAIIHHFRPHLLAVSPLSLVETRLSLVFCLLLAGSLWHKGAYNRNFTCMEASYSFLWHKEPARSKQNTPNSRAGSLWHKIAGASITREALDQ